METQELIDELTTLPDQIYEEEKKLIEVQHKLQEQKFLLRNSEAHLLSQDYGPITGKNEQTREAQLHLRTAPERVQLLELETAVRLQGAKVDWLRNLLTAFGAVTKLVKG